MSLVVVDGFLNNPDDTRAFALTQPFTTTGNYPGKRTRSFANPDWIPHLEKFLPRDEKITWFDTHPFSYNGAFQVCTAEDGNSWIHRDATDWAAVLFLTPAAPLAAGLTLYRHAATQLLEHDGSKTADLAVRDAPDHSKWEVAATVGNVLNRLVLFRGRQFHKSSHYFGASPAEGRLFQVLFFNTTSPPLQRWSLALPRILVVIFSTNRYAYLRRMLESLRRNVDFGGCFVHTLLVDDFPIRRDAAKLHSLRDRFCIDTVISHPENMGLGKSWREVWHTLKERQEEWVLHLEEDIEFNAPLKVKDMVEAYASSEEPLSQIFLKRNVCYAPEDDFVAKIERGDIGDDRPGSLVGVVNQRMYFVAMASLYPRDLALRFDFATDPHEHNARAFFGDFFGMWSGMWGQRHDPPLITHIGEVSRGIKISDYDSDASRFAHLPTSRDYHFVSGLPTKTLT